MNIPDRKNDVMNGENPTICNCSCKNETRERIQIHHTDLLGVEIVLHDVAVRVHCGDCGCSSYSIPYMDGLVSAVAMLRIKEPMKLFGKDIKFLRKAAELTAVSLARILEVSPETLSRWENDRAPIGAAAEKLFRLTMADMFKDNAPCIHYSPSEIFNMNVRSCLSIDSRLILHLELVEHMEKIGYPAQDVYSVRRQEAA